MLLLLGVRCDAVAPAELGCGTPPFHHLFYETRIYEVIENSECLTCCWWVIKPGVDFKATVHTTVYVQKQQHLPPKQQILGNSSGKEKHF